MSPAFKLALGIMGIGIATSVAGGVADVPAVMLAGFGIAMLAYPIAIISRLQATIGPDVGWSTTLCGIVLIVAGISIHVYPPVMIGLGMIGLGAWRRLTHGSTSVHQTHDISNRRRVVDENFDPVWEVMPWPIDAVDALARSARPSTRSHGSWANGDPDCVSDVATEMVVGPGDVRRFHADDGTSIEVLGPPAEWRDGGHAETSVRMAGGRTWIFPLTHDVASIVALMRERTAWLDGWAKQYPQLERLASTLAAETFRDVESADTDVVVMRSSSRVILVRVEAIDAASGWSGLQVRVRMRIDELQVETTVELIEHGQVLRTESSAVQHPGPAMDPTEWVRGGWIRFTVGRMLDDKTSPVGWLVGSNTSTP